MKEIANKIRIVSFFAAFLLFSLNGFGQDPENVIVTPEVSQSAEEIKADKEQCFAYADTTLDATEHKTIKNTAAGAAAGAVVGKILGKPGVGVIVGGGAGAYRGHKKSGQDQREFNETYASCLRDKGYSVEIQDD